MKNSAPSVMLFRRDLRLYDNAALHAANSFNDTLYIYIHEEAKDEKGSETTIDKTWQTGAASQWWLHHSLAKIKEALSIQKQDFIFFKTSHQKPIEEILLELCQTNNCHNIFWNRRYEPHHIKQDTVLKRSLQKHNITVNSFNNNLLSEPWTKFTKQGTPFKVFTPYWRHCKNTFLNESSIAEPLPKPHFNQSKKQWHIQDQVALDDLQLLPKKPDWAINFNQYWQVGETHAQQAWDDFLKNSINRYENSRNIPSIAGTSKLSPHLAFGEISVRQIWHDVMQQKSFDRQHSDDLDRYLSEIGWREFSYYQLYHFPELPEKNFNPRFNHFQWDEPSEQLKAWQKGMTGYPLIDAGLRELWQTGYMHNRVRMVVASFLCKDLMIHWQEGAKWFWDTLLDADLASNSASWQWCAGCGADAAPFFRIFNPTIQSEKFDAEGLYIRRWVPELSKMPNKFIHKPHEAPEEILQQAQIELGNTYPKPIVDHKSARLEALERYKNLKTTNN